MTTWTDIDRPRILDGLDASMFRQLCDNATWIKDAIQSAHLGHSHGFSIDGNVGSMPAAGAIVRWTGATYSVVSSWGFGGTNPTFNTRAGTGRCTLDLPTFSGVDDYAAIVSPFTTPSIRKEPLESYASSVYHIGAAQLEVRTYVIGEGVTDAPTLADSGFTIAIWGKHAATTTSWDPWLYMPEWLDGAPVPTEFWTNLLTNIGTLRSTLFDQHSELDGSHRTYQVPAQLGKMTYRTTIDTTDQPEWVLEPWSHGVPEGSWKQIDAPFEDDAGNAQVAQLASFRNGTPGATSYGYGCLVTPNVYDAANDRCRLMHPYQYRDSWMVAPRFWESIGAEWSWQDTDAGGTGAPDSFAFARFISPDKGAIAYGTRLSGIDTDAAADTNQMRVLLASLVIDELNTIKRLFLSHHGHARMTYNRGSDDNSHIRRPPGFLGAGRVTYSAGYTLETWASETIDSPTLVSSPNGCQVNFSYDVTSYRELAVFATHDNGSSSPSFLSSLVLVDDPAAFTVYAYGGATPYSDVHESFNFAVFGVGVQ